MVLAAAALAAIAVGEAAQPVQSPTADVTATLDALFADPLLEHALVGVRVESLRDGRVIYTRNAATHVVPASNMKIVTMAVAADRLGWDFTYETRLEAAGPIEAGVLTGDLVVTGSGDPSIVSGDGAPSPVFDEWATAAWNAGIRRVNGRIVGDDNAFDDEGIGAGWSWDYLGDGYATGTGALIYNENIVTVRTEPGPSPGDPVVVTVTPDGHGLDVRNDVRTGPADSTARVALFRMPGDATLYVRGSLPAGAKPSTRTASIENPTMFFVSALRLALARRGIVVRDGVWDIDDVPAQADSPVTGRTVIARRQSLPLSTLGGRFLKVSQNLYGETLLKTIGRLDGAPGTANAGGRSCGR